VAAQLPIKTASALKTIKPVRPTRTHNAFCQTCKTANEGQEHEAQVYFKNPKYSQAHKIRPTDCEDETL
jgi:hypothetical protein